MSITIKQYDVTQAHADKVAAHRVESISGRVPRTLIELPEDELEQTIDSAIEQLDVEIYPWVLPQAIRYVEAIHQWADTLLRGLNEELDRNPQ